MIFKEAIVRKPCPELINGLTTASLGKPDYIKALNQHNNYIETLKNCGLEVTILEADSSYPDSTFIEDIALCTSHCAIITNPGANSRNGETIGIEVIMQKFYQNIEKIIFPGTLEAGDVMMVGSNYYIGISERTNEAGADQLIKILAKYNLNGIKIPFKNVLHLKTGLSYLENNNLLVNGEFINHPAFENFNKIIVEDIESYAANSLWINGKVLVAKGFPATKRKIEKAGYQTIETDVSEFQKIDGGLSCLSLRF